MFKPALGPTRTPIQWVPANLSPGVQWLGHVADHSPPSSAKVKNECTTAPLPLYAFMVCTGTLPFCATKYLFSHMIS
jgi:hypothetical protein